MMTKAAVRKELNAQAIRNRVRIDDCDGCARVMAVKRVVRDESVRDFCAACMNASSEEEK